MDHANRGKPLEAACILGARLYREHGEIFHRPTERTWTPGGWKYTAT